MTSSKIQGGALLSGYTRVVVVIPMRIFRIYISGRKLCLRHVGQMRKMGQYACAVLNLVEKRFLS